MYCTNCGNKIEDGSKFCVNCGKAVQSNIQQPAQQYHTFSGNTDYGNVNTYMNSSMTTVGFSNRVNDPEILAAVKRNRRVSKIFSLFIVPLPLICFVIYGQVSKSIELVESVKYGGVVSAVFLLFALFGFLRDRAKNTYEAVVTDKKIRHTYRHNNSDERDLVTEYITVARTTDGKKKKIVERSGSQIWAYNYMNVGDRFRYHPQFHFPYELYDKSKAPYIACVCCGTKNSVQSDRCTKCNLPLLK